MEFGLRAGLEVGDITLLLDRLRRRLLELSTVMTLIAKWRYDRRAGVL